MKCKYDLFICWNTNKNWKIKSLHKNITYVEYVNLRKLYFGTFKELINICSVQYIRTSVR